MRAAIGSSRYADPITKYDRWIKQTKANDKTLNEYEETAYEFIGRTRHPMDEPATRRPSLIPPGAQLSLMDRGLRCWLRPAQKRGPTRLGQIVDSALDGGEPAIDIAVKNFGSVRDRRLEVSWTSRALRQRGRAGESALAIRRHDRRPRSSAFDGIATPALVLLDETGSAAGIFARRRRGRTDQHLDFAVRQYSEQAKTEPSAKVAKPGVAFTPFPFRREASGQPNFVAGGRAVDPLQDEFEIEGQLEFADHDDRRVVVLQRQQIAASNFAFDDEAEPFEEGLDRLIE